jgi:hypothetical protein
MDMKLAARRILWGKTVNAGQVNQTRSRELNEL